MYMHVKLNIMKKIKTIINWGKQKHCKEKAISVVYGSVNFIMLSTNIRKLMEK